MVARILIKLWQTFTRSVSVIQRDHRITPIFHWIVNKKYNSFPTNNLIKKNFGLHLGQFAKANSVEIVKKQIYTATNLAQIFVDIIKEQLSRLLI